MLRNRLLILPMLAATLALAACGGDSKNDETAAKSTATAAATDPPPGKVEVTGKLGSKPTITITPESPTPPGELQKVDIETGKGKEAKKGDKVSVQYVGVTYHDGKEFDASWNRGEPFEFQLGGGQVIPGWDQGVEGMKVGGRRELVIPPDLGYGDQGSPPTIPGGETLVFVVDLEKGEPGSGH